MKARTYVTTGNASLHLDWQPVSLELDLGWPYRWHHLIELSGRIGLDGTRCFRFEICILGFYFHAELLR